MVFDVIWGSVLLLAAAVEVWALRRSEPEDTLSERVRAWFRVKTAVGRVVFGVLWAGFAVWFGVHILS